MGIDISQFLETFYEESFEGLDIMETNLLQLDGGEVDDETINAIFRAAHSIKGGSGTFGLMEVADFTHVLETLLDEMRDGVRPVTSEAVSLMLASVDVLRDMLTALRNGEAIDEARVKEVHGQLEAMLKGGAPEAAQEASEQAAETGTAPAAGGGWRIRFRPLVHLFKTGNDPVRMFKELEELGELSVEADLEELPPLDDLDPEDCFIAWTLELRGEVPEQEVREVFAWVEEDCELVIEPLGGDAGSPAPAEAAEEPAPEPATAPAPESRPEPEGSAPRATEAPQEPAASAAPKPSAPARAAPKGGAKKGGADSGSIRVGIDKVDALINMVGELVITQSMLNQIGEEFTMDKLQKLQEGLAELERHTRELQENVMRIRMLPISFAFNRFPRLVHDLSRKLGKKIELKMVGEHTELDKTVMEKIGDPLVHLVRNSLDHGIEPPEERLAKGKPETGVLELCAYHQGGNIVIEIHDDGAGLNTERILKKAIEKGLVKEGDNLPKEKIHELIFHPGFSTAEQVSDVSGRGVGMDVVKRNIKDLGGSVEVRSEEGVGSTFTIRLPLTLAILDGQLMRVGKETFVIPLVSITESLQVKEELVKSIAGGAELYRLRDDYVPIVRLHEIFGIEPDARHLSEGLLMVVEGDGQHAGLFVDELMGQQQVVIKSLELNFKPVDGISGATILGDGTVALIIDVPGLVKLARRRHRRDGKHDQEIAA